MGKPIGGLITLGATVVDLKTGINSIPGGVNAIPEGDPSTVHSLVLRAGTANDDVIYIGGTGMTVVGDAMMVLEAGDGMGFDLPAGDYVDLANIAVLAQATTADDVIYVFGLQ